MKCVYFDEKYVYFDWDSVLKSKKVVVADSITELWNKLQSDILDCVEVEKAGCTNLIRVKGTIKTANFCYFDPLLNVKRAYYLQKKPVQFKSENGDWVDVSFAFEWSDEYSYRVVEEKKRLINRKKRTSSSNEAKNRCPVLNKEEESKKESSGFTFLLDEVIKKNKSKKETKKRKPKKEYKHNPYRITNKELAEWLAEGNREFYSPKSGSIEPQTTFKYDPKKADRNVDEYIKVRNKDGEWSKPTYKYCFGKEVDDKTAEIWENMKRAAINCNMVTLVY